MISKKREYRFFWLLTLLFLLAGPFPSWGSELDQVPEAQTAIANGPLIAVILPLSGSFAQYGKAMKAGFEQGFSTTANSPTRPYRVKYFDSQADPETARALINQLIIEGEVAIATGTPLNATAWTVSRACENDHLPYLIVGADQDNLIGRETVSNFRLTPRHSTFKEMLTKFMAARKDKFKTMGIIYDNSICAIKKARQLRALCAAENIDLSIWKQWQTYSNNRDNFYDLLNVIKERQPEILFLVTNPKLGNRLWQQGKRMEIMPETTITIPTATETDLSVADGQQIWAGDQLIFAPPGLNSEKRPVDGKASVSAGNPLATASSAAAAVIVNALDKSLSLTATEIIKSLETTSIKTVYGTVNFSTEPGGHQNPVSWNLYRNDANGQSKIVFPQAKPAAE